MTEQTIPADKVREIIARHRDGASDRGGMILADLEALLPARPTLADMTSEERDGCERMQCDVKGEDARAVIFNPHWEYGSARVLWPSGFSTYPGWERVTPRPDLPRMEWPGTGQDGEEATKVDYVSVAGGRTAYGPWTVARLRKKPAPAPAPPNTLTEGSEWDNVDALARACEESGRDQIVVADKDGDVFVWGVDAEWWETGLPGCDYAPHTIIHAGKKADQ